MFVQFLITKVVKDVQVIKFLMKLHPNADLDAAFYSAISNNNFDMVLFLINKGVHDRD